MAQLLLLCYVTAASGSAMLRAICPFKYLPAALPCFDLIRSALMTTVIVTPFLSRRIRTQARRPASPTAPSPH